MANIPVENNKEEVPFAYYCELFEKLDPAEAAQRTGVSYDAEKKLFTMILMGTQYQIRWPDAEVLAESESALAIKYLPAKTFLLRYLLEGKRVDDHGAFLTFREMPWGELYIQPFTGRCLTRAAFTFGTRLAAFRAAMERLGAKPVAHGDAGFEFTLMENFRMQILVWEGDDEFPPNSQILYSDNFATAFAAEDRVVSGDLAISAIKALM